MDMNCELCGAETRMLKRMLVEGTCLMACPNCMKFGKVVDEPRGGAAPSSPGQVRVPVADNRWKAKDVFEQDKAQELVRDYPERIRKARQSKGLTPEQFGKLINEKKSVISNLEAGEIRPNEALRKKVERTLGIKLMESVKELKMQKKGKPATTLGDIVRLEKE